MKPAKFKPLGMSDGVWSSDDAMGAAPEVVVASGTTEIVSSGHVDRNPSVYGIQKILSGGSAVSATLFGGGQQFVYGQCTGTVVSSGGGETVFNGFGSIQAIVLHGGTLTVSSGGGDLQTAGGSGGSVIISQDGGSQSDIIVASGSQIVEGQSQFATVDGVQTVSGVIANHDAVSGQSSTHYLQAAVVEAGGQTNYTSLGAYASEFVLDFGSTISTTVSGVGAFEQVYDGGIDSGTQVYAGGELDIRSARRAGLRSATP